MPIYIHAIDYEQCDLTQYSLKKYGEQLEKIKMNGPVKLKLGQGRNSGILHYILTYFRAFKGTHSSALGF